MLLVFVVLGPLVVGWTLLINIPTAIYVAWLVGGGPAAVAAPFFYLMTVRASCAQNSELTSKTTPFWIALLGAIAGMLGQTCFVIGVATIRRITVDQTFSFSFSIFLALQEIEWVNL